ncbi:MAG: hypothetical protein VX473_00440 [Candidatus Thermoplasmatota archaeon]|nr:hypothetical protein [Candidatus Thermoplasmatota archaeon]
MAGIKPVVMMPDDNARSYAESIAPARGGPQGPDLHTPDEMRRLATPWQVAMARAKLLDNCELPQGVVLDPACGSATQLAALCTALNRPGLGVELSGAAAPLAAVNLEHSALWAENDWGASSRVLWGDGTDAESIMKAYQDNIGSTTEIALLHIDPARPQDAQQHTLDEMQPRLDHLLLSWSSFLGKNPALILDLSPRLSDAQRIQVDDIVSSIWGGVARTWQWMTQGRGRIDRLSLWVGPVASLHQNRLVRLSKNGDISMLEGSQESSCVEQSQIELGQYLTIVDPSLISSGLGESWRKIAINSGNSGWLKLTGRRPVFISDEAISENDTVTNFVQISGCVVETVSDISMDSISNLAKLANNAGLTSLKLRCKVDPDIQPKLQSTLDREMKEIGSESESSLGFITESVDGYVICLQS